MIKFKEVMAKATYHKIRNGAVSDALCFKLAEMYARKPLTESQRVRGKMYLDTIRNGNMSEDEFMEIFRSKDRILYGANDDESN